MRPPRTPPSLHDLLARTDIDGLAQLLRVGALVDGRYLHWDELHHRSPPDGLDHATWWLGITLARSALKKELPLLGKSDRPLTFATPDPVQRALLAIDRTAAGTVTMADPAVAADDRDRYLVSSLIEEAITSSQLEGAATTRAEAKVLLRSGRLPRDRSERMIVNNYRAMEHIRDLDTLELIPETVLQLHRIVTDGTLDDPSAAGRLRRADEAVTVDDYEGNLLHDPPPATSLPERLERLCAFANRTDDVEPFVHPVLKAILLHFMLAYDHPFVDGNGRTARALFYWSLVGNGYWLLEYVSISRLLNQAPVKYARAFLLTESDDLDTTYFILHQLDVIERAIADLHAYLARKGAEQRSAERLLHLAPGLADRLNHRQVALLGHALRHPGFGYTVASHRRSHRVTHQTARTDLLKLAAAGLLEQRKRGRAFLFRAPDDLRQRIEVTAGNSS